MAGLLTRLLGASATDYSAGSDYWYTSRGVNSSSGFPVTYEKALGIAAFWDCVKVISEDVAKLPLVVYERLADGKRPAPEHTLYPKLHNKPNGYQTSYVWRRLMEVCRLLWGNGYSEIIADGRSINLIPLHPSRVRPELQANGTIIYYVKKADNISEREIAQESMFHLIGETLDGVKGMSIITAARNSLGLSIAAEEHGARSFANGVSKRGVLEHPGTLSLEAQKRLVATFDEANAGVANAGKTTLLEEGMTWKEIGMSNEDAQFLESRRFQGEETARWFRMKPHKIGILDHATFSNIEHESIDYVIDTLLPELVNWEQSLWDRCLSPTDQERYFAEFRVEGLLRGDALSRGQAMQIWRQNGVINADEWRAVENMNPIPGGAGKVYLQMANYVPLGTVPIQTTAAKALALARTDPLAEELAGRVLKKQRDRMAKVATSMAADNDGWKAWLVSFLSDSAEEIARSMHITGTAAREFCRSQGAEIMARGAGEIEAKQQEWRQRLVALATEDSE